MIIERKLQVMGAELVAPSAPLANFIPVQRSGNVLYVAGHLPRKSNGDIAFLGKVGGGVTVEQGYDAAKLAAVNCLASIKDVIGDLDRVKQVLKLLVMVNAVPEFDRHFVCSQRRLGPAGGAIRRRRTPRSLGGGHGQPPPRQLRRSGNGRGSGRLGLGPQNCR